MSEIPRFIWTIALINDNNRRGVSFVAIRPESFFQLSGLPAITRRGWRWVGGRAVCVVTRVVLLPFAGPIKIAITRWTVYYTYVRRLIAHGRFASDESCFKYNIRDAMPSICYDDDSANEKSHRGNRRNCIAAPFSLWLVTSSLFFLSLFFFFVTRASSSSILQIDRYCCARFLRSPLYTHRASRRRR